MPKCQGLLRGYLRGNCDREATVEREGKCWCWQHDPVRYDAERKARAAAARKEWEEMQARVEARSIRSDLEIAAGIRDLSDDVLRRLVELGGLAAAIAKASEGKLQETGK
jgi:hypothetical protein